MALGLDPSETIAALAGPSGPGFRGIVRLSGPQAHAIAGVGFEPEDPSDWGRRAEARTGRLSVEGLGRTVPALVLRFPGPRTYTGQDLAEIHAPGSVPILELILAQCLTHGARAAEPGEFTLRAFLSGRIDLTAAEAVLGVIDAGSTSQLRAALDQLAGGLAHPIRNLRDRLLDVLAHLEAGLDFVDEADVDPLARAALASELTIASEELGRLAEQMTARDRPEGYPRVVLVGPPNAGKSRLFNALIGGQRALVSPRAGTTRDYLTAVCECDGIPVELVDTAGAEAPRDDVETRAQASRAAQLESAFLVLDCRSADTNIVAVSDPASSLALSVWTKADLGPPPKDRDWYVTSVEQGQGIKTLKQAIGRAVRSRQGEGLHPAGTAARCRESLAGASSSLANAASAVAADLGDELVCIDLHAALDELGKVVGATVTDDILDRIFRKFCIGK